MGRVRNISMGLAKKGLAVIPEKVSLFMKHKLKMLLELSCCKKRQKSPNQETSLGNRVLGVFDALDNNMGGVRNVSMGLAVIPEKVSLFIMCKFKMLLELSCSC